jgi:hypothetical protein
MHAAHGIPGISDTVELGLVTALEILDAILPEATSIGMTIP